MTCMIATLHLLREQGAGGSNPLIPTILRKATDTNQGPFFVGLRSPSGPFPVPTRPAPEKTPETFPPQP